MNEVSIPEPSASGSERTAVVLTCAEVREALSQYDAGVLGPAHAKDIEAHLRGCSGCARELEVLRSEDEMLSEALSTLRPDASFRARVARACLDLQVHAENVANTIPQRGWKIFRYALALLSVGYFVALSLYLSPPPVEDFSGQGVLQGERTSLFWVNLPIYLLALFLLLGSRLVAGVERWISGKLGGHPDLGPSRLEVLTLEVLGICGVVAASLFHYLYLAH